MSKVYSATYSNVSLEILIMEFHSPDMTEGTGVRESPGRDGSCMPRAEKLAHHGEDTARFRDEMDEDERRGDAPPHKQLVR